MSNINKIIFLTILCSLFLISGSVSAIDLNDSSQHSNTQYNPDLESFNLNSPLEKGSLNDNSYSDNIIPAQKNSTTLKGNDTENLLQC